MKRLLKPFKESIAYYKHKREIARRKRRLTYAIDLAEEMHILNNGTRYFVLEVDFKPGHYIVRNMNEIKAMQKNGAFSKRANYTDFLREALYYTKSECLSTVKGRHIKKETPFYALVIYWLIGVIAFMTLIVVLLKR